MDSKLEMLMLTKEPEYVSGYSKQVVFKDEKKLDIEPICQDDDEYYNEVEGSSEEEENTEESESKHEAKNRHTVNFSMEETTSKVPGVKSPKIAEAVKKKKKKCSADVNIDK